MISFIVPTIGRPSLQRTLASIEMVLGDEIIVVGNVFPAIDVRAKYISCVNGQDSGVKERRIGIDRASQRYLAFMDDDDMYVKGHRAAMSQAITAAPGKPVLFKMQYVGGHTLWQDKEIRCGNVGTPMILIPNMPTKLGVWDDGGVSDFTFLRTMKWLASDVVWREEIIAQVRPL